MSAKLPINYIIMYQYENKRGLFGCASVFCLGEIHMINKWLGLYCAPIVLGLWLASVIALSVQFITK